MGLAFCMGPGSAMGTSGLRWAGSNPDADCSLLWAEAFGLTSAGRAVLGCIAVFLLSVLAQFLSTSSDNQLQQSKALAKRRNAQSLFPSRSVYYDPGIGAATELLPPCHAKAQQTKQSDQKPRCKHAEAAKAQAAKAQAVQTAGQQPAETQVPEYMRPLAPKLTTVSTAGSCHRAHPTSAALLPPLPVISVRSMSTTGIKVEAPVSASVKVSNWTHLGDALLRGVRILLAYLLMLAAMTYDLTLISSIVAGFTTGFFVFAKDTAKVPVSADPCCA